MVSFLLLVTLTQRVPWIVSDALVLATTWWFAYQSYRMQAGGIHGKSLGSSLLYNGMYLDLQEIIDSDWLSIGSIYFM